MQWDQLLKTVVAVAQEAGQVLLDGGHKLRSVAFQDARDVKLEADQASELLIRERLSKAFPYPIYGEELGGDAGLLQRYEPYWVVDPLDGTYNYLRGSELCAVSIGLMRGETPILGIIHDFNRNVCYSGYAGGAFQINGNKQQASWETRQEQAALVTGFPAGMSRDDGTMESFLETIAPFKKVRMVGSAALALAYVAAGIYDVYHERSIRLWDVAAGLALVQAAGGAIRMQPSAGNKPLAYDIWAGEAKFFPKN